MAMASMAAGPRRLLLAAGLFALLTRAARVGTTEEPPELGHDTATVTLGTIPAGTKLSHQPRGSDLLGTRGGQEAGMDWGAHATSTTPSEVKVKFDYNDGDYLLLLSAGTGKDDPACILNADGGAQGGDVPRVVVFQANKLRCTIREEPANSAHFFVDAAVDLEYTCDWNGVSCA
mmetsp:Transcript_21332/g.61677  ORF Transcript_21332/g.61677 Transcript_21332/m.61677 type:complete len:175 (-) Transcript_21332:49-573(-)